MNKKNLKKSMLFFMSPFLSFPSILYGIYRKSTFSLKLFVLLFGLISFLYVPNQSNDKAFYFNLYWSFESFNFNEFIAYLVFSKRPDFFLHFLVYLFAKLSINVQYLFMTITIFTVGSFYYVFKQVSSRLKLSYKEFFLCFLLVLFSFSLPDLFSGIKFYFASAFVILAFYRGLVQSKLTSSIICLFLAICTHFSSLLFVPIFVLIKLAPNKTSYFYFIYLLSFFFLLIPKEFLFGFMSNLNLTEGHAGKANVYLGNEDFVTKGIEGSSGYFLIYTFSILWTYFAYIYLLFTKHHFSIFKNILYLSFAIVNITYSAPTVYARYLIPLKFIFAIVMLIDYNKTRNVFLLIMSVLLFSFNFITSLIILRYNFIETFSIKYIWTLLAVFMREITSDVFLF